MQLQNSESVFIPQTHAHTQASLIIFHNLQHCAVILFRSCSNLSISDGTQTISIRNPNHNL